MELINEHMGTLALLPVEGDAVEHGIRDNKMADGFELFAQAMNIKYHHTLV